MTALKNLTGVTVGHKKRIVVVCKIGNASAVVSVRSQMGYWLVFVLYFEQIWTT